MGCVVQALLLATWLQNLQGDGTDTDLDAHDLVLQNLGTQVQTHPSGAAIGHVGVVSEGGGCGCGCVC